MLIINSPSFPVGYSSVEVTAFISPSKRKQTNQETILAGRHHKNRINIRKNRKEGQEEARSVCGPSFWGNGVFHRVSSKEKFTLPHEDSHGLKTPYFLSINFIILGFNAISAEWGNANFKPHPQRIWPGSSTYFHGTGGKKAMLQASVV